MNTNWKFVETFSSSFFWHKRKVLLLKVKKRREESVWKYETNDMWELRSNDNANNLIKVTQGKWIFLSSQSRETFSMNEMRMRIENEFDDDGEWNER